MAWNRPSNDGRAVSTKPPLRRGHRPRPTVRGAIAGSVIVLIATVAAWWLWPEGESAGETPPPRNEGLIKEVKPAAPREAKAMPAEKPVAEEPRLTSVQRMLKGATLLQAHTNRAGTVVERYRLANGTIHEHVIDPPPLFSNPSDQIIASVIGAKAGTPIPPLPPMRPNDLNNAFVNSLLEPIRVNENDSPEKAALKMAVKATREEIAQIIKSGDGRTVVEILQDHVADNNHKVALKGEAIEQLHEVIRTEGEDFAAEYLEKVNKRLETYGISPIKMPSGQRRRN